MSLLFDNTITPPAPHEVVDWWKDLLAADGTLSTWLGDGEVLAHHTPAQKPDRYVEVRELEENQGRRQSQRSRSDRMPLQVMTDCAREDGAVPNKQEWHAAMHRQIYELTLGEKPDTDHGVAILGMQRVTVPTPMRTTPDGNRTYSTANYSVLIAPKA